MSGEKITIEKRVEDSDKWVFVVWVGGKEEGTKHEVTVRRGYYKGLTASLTPPEELVKKSFEFLLEREPKESILSQFDLSLIQKYFPEYEEEAKKF